LTTAPTEQLHHRFSLAGRRVILTGAAGILGKAFAAALADAGASLLLVDRDQAALDDLAAGLATGTSGQTIAALAADLADRTEDARITAKATELLGGAADGLVNNAASKGPDLRAFFAPDEEFSPEIWRDIFAVNLEAPFFLAVAFARELRRNGKAGSIVNIASIYGHMAPDQRIYEGSNYLGGEIRSPAVYSASKAGVLGLTRHLATLWGAEGIRVNSIAPGGVSSGQNGVFNDRYSARVPMGRMATTDDMVGTLVFLLSDASGYVTGQNWLVDGGLSAW